MIPGSIQDLYVIYSKSSSGMSLTYDEVYVTREDAEKKAEDYKEIIKQIEDRTLPEKSNLRTTVYVSTLDEFISEYGEYKRWEGEYEKGDE